MSEEPVVITSRLGRVGHLRLNRPKAINALTAEMVELLHDALTDWEHDPDVQAVLITGAGERGLCAGGDIVAIYHDTQTGGSASAEFWRAEYHLNHLIATYPKPVVAVMEGIVLGGGIGISAHASVRVVTERSSLGMPETGIGFFPDVGGTRLLSHAPGELGTHLALTAGSVGPGDAIAIGLADAYIPSSDLDALIEEIGAIRSAADVDGAVALYAQPPPEAPLLAERDWIDDAYTGDDVSAILARVRDAAESGTAESAAAKAAKRIGRNSPTALAVTLHALRAAAHLPDLAATLEQEYRLAVRFLHSHDLGEGIRAQVMDKDRQPRWDPPDVAAVTTAVVSPFFAPLDDELGLVPERNEAES